MTVLPDKPLSWEPKLIGIDYCSPACGRGCKHSEHERAVIESSMLALAMGEGWKTRVWENLGWFWEVLSPDGRIHLRARHKNYNKGPVVGFGAEINGSGYVFSSAGSGYSHSLQWFGEGKTPQEAINNAKVAAYEDLAKIQAAVEGL